MARPKKVACVLFDCDGVLVDSEPVAARLNAFVYQQMGVPATLEDCLVLCGKDASHIPDVPAMYGISITAEDFIAKQKALRSAGEMVPTVYLESDLELMPGIRELLSALHSKGVKTGLVSTSIASHLLILLNRFGLTSAFDVIITGDMPGEHKPKPGPYLVAMEQLGVLPEQTVVVEDSPSGIAAGVASGAYVLGFCGSMVKQDVSAAHEVLPSYTNFDLV